MHYSPLPPSDHTLNAVFEAA